MNFLAWWVKPNFTNFYPHFAFFFAEIWQKIGKICPKILGSEELTKDPHVFFVVLCWKSDYKKMWLIQAFFAFVRFWYILTINFLYCNRPHWMMNNHFCCIFRTKKNKFYSSSAKCKIATQKSFFFHKKIRKQTNKKSTKNGAIYSNIFFADFYWILYLHCYIFPVLYIVYISQNIPKKPLQKKSTNVAFG